MASPITYSLAICAARSTSGSAFTPDKHLGPELDAAAHALRQGRQIATAQSPTIRTMA
ncbi:MAG: hypothetical protein WAM11_02900 [Cyanobium sp.]